MIYFKEIKIFIEIELNNPYLLEVPLHFMNKDYH